MHVKKASTRRPSLKKALVIKAIENCGLIVTYKDKEICISGGLAFLPNGKLVVLERWTYKEPESTEIVKILKGLLKVKGV